MAAQNLLELIQLHQPDKSVRQIEAEAGLPVNTIAYYLKPSVKLVRIPRAEIISDIAAAVRCDPVEVVRAFAADVGIPFNAPPLSIEERELLRIYRRLSTQDQRTLRLMAASLLQASQDSQGRV